MQFIEKLKQKKKRNDRLPPAVPVCRGEKCTAFQPGQLKIILVCPKYMDAVSDSRNSVVDKVLVRPYFDNKFGTTDLYRNLKSFEIYLENH